MGVEPRGQGALTPLTEPHIWQGRVQTGQGELGLVSHSWVLAELQVSMKTWKDIILVGWDETCYFTQEQATPPPIFWDWNIQCFLVSLKQSWLKSERQVTFHSFLSAQESTMIFSKSNFNNSGVPRLHRDEQMIAFFDSYVNFQHFLFLKFSYYVIVVF